MALEQDYDIVARLGEGAFGKVYKAVHKESGDAVAVKQIKLGSKSWDEALKSTELAALRALRHNFIVRLRELLRSPKDGSLYYVFEFVGSDLFRLLRQHPQGLEECRATELQRQVFAALAHIHHHNFFHRDIKPENILYDEMSDSVRIADFGEARSVRARPPFTDYVGTRWYRAPECLLRDRTYSSPVDVWAAGLVFAEMLRGSPVFCGTSSIDQLYKIFVVLGQPLTDWPEFSRLAEASRFRVPEKAGCGLERVLQRASHASLGFLGDVLRLNPRRRPLSRKCLEHSFFSRLPPLDLGRAEAFRAGPSVSCTSLNEDQTDTGRTHVSGWNEMTTRKSEERAVDADAAGRPISSARPSTSLPGPGQAHELEDDKRKSSVKAGPLDSDDLDLDAELDKILSVGSAKKMDPPSAVRNDPGNGRATLSTGGPTATPPYPMPRGRSLPASKALVAPAEVWPKEKTEPTGGVSVDVLFENLCVDLGVVSGKSHEVSMPGSESLRGRTGLPSIPATSTAQQDSCQSSGSLVGTISLTGVLSNLTLAQDVPSAGYLPQGDSNVTPADASACRREVSAPPFVVATARQKENFASSSAEHVPESVVENLCPSERRGREATSHEEVRSEFFRTRRTSRSSDFSDRLGDVDTSSADRAVGGPIRSTPGRVHTFGALASSDARLVAVAGSAEDKPCLRLSAEKLLPEAQQVSLPSSPSSSQVFSADIPGNVAATSLASSLGDRCRRPASATDRRLSTQFPSLAKLQGQQETAKARARGSFSGASSPFQTPSPSTSIRPQLPYPTPAESTEESTRKSSRRTTISAPWTAEESSQLRRIVKRIVKASGACDKDALWEQVSLEFGGLRNPRECKQQYVRDYKAHQAGKTAVAAGNG